MPKEGLKYDLEERTLEFALSVRRFVRYIPRNISSIEDSKQLIRSSGSVGANYIEASEAISAKDFVHRIKICRKEAKESYWWLMLLDVPSELSGSREALLQESMELTKIFGSIVYKKMRSA